jgi:hypothetical protein
MMATAGEAFFNPAIESGRENVSVTVTGLTTIPGAKLGAQTDDGCMITDYPAGSGANRVDFDFDRNRLTEPGQSITVDPGAGWKYTVEWRE